MAKIVLVLFVASVALVGFYVQKYLFGTEVTLPDIEDGYFGPGKSTPDDPSIIPFKLTVSSATLTDLQSRLEQTRFFTALEDSTDFQYGFHVNYLKEVQRHWLHKFDWKKQEDKLNSLPQYRTQIEGIKVHFLHAKPPSKQYKTVFPLLLVHGWPGSVYEFYKIIPMLTDPKSYGLGGGDVAFEVIAPSIPGYGFSEASKKKGFGVSAASRVFAKLMKRLKFEKYFLQGGDWGSIIVTTLAQMYPERTIGLHLNMASPGLFDGLTVAKQLIGVIFPSLVINPEDHQKMYPLSAKFLELLQESGYMHIQATKPDTVGFALNNSPLGLAAYILEKFSTWTNPAYKGLPDGGLTRHWKLDELLTNIMIYWTTGTIASSQRFYKEFFRDTLIRDYYDKAPVKVPTGVAMCPHELMRFPESFLTRKYTNITHYQDMLRCGHFAAFEEPKLLATDIFSFARPLCSSSSKKD